MIKYFKNFILCGDVDFYCLICEETFNTVDDVEKHIRWENHRKILKGQALFPKFRRDFIYKIKTKFYCEICNVITTTIESTTNHIKSELHATNKANPDKEKAKIKCKRDTGYVIVSDIIVTKKEWNAVVNKRCLICNVDVSSVDAHVETDDHIIKLIQAKVVKENDDRCYRKINPENVYCFICKKPVSTETLTGHWDDQDHIQNSKISINRTSKVTSAAKSLQNETLKKLMNLQKALYVIDVKAGISTCKQCKKVIKFRLDEMLDHQVEHAEERSEQSESDEVTTKRGLVIETIDSSSDEVEVVFSEVPDHGKRRANLKEYGKKYNIKLNEGGSKGYCFICDVHMSAHIRVFKEHVRGCIHRGLLEYKGLKKAKKRDRPTYKTEPLKKYLKSVYHSPSLQVVWVNAQFCVDNNSFLLVAPVRNVVPYKFIRCHACNIEYKIEDNEKHLKTAQHKANFVDAEVIVTLEKEFVRELAPNLFHCGFCNRLLAYYDNVLHHIKNLVHCDNRVNKDLSSRLVQEWFNDSVMTTFSTNPDVMYLQLVERGILSDVPKVILKRPPKSS